MDDTGKTVAGVAEWMWAAIRRAGHLDQAAAADHIRRHFGERFLTPTGTGGWIVNQDVRDALAELHQGRAQYAGAGPTGRWSLLD
jgi:hypothetical protein